MTVLTHSELERMRASVRPVEITDSEARRRKLKVLSDEKVKQWPNTLQATRKKKENWKNERLVREEEGRKIIDAEEAELQRERRSEAIRRANTIMYEATDKMKFLRSQQQYSEVVMEREQQMKEKAVQNVWASEKESAYHDESMRQLDEGARRDSAEAAARIFKARAVAASQHEQLGEFRGNCLSMLRAEKLEGEMIQKRAYADQEEEEKTAVRKTATAKNQMREMLAANETLRLLKLEDSEKEQLNDALRKEVMVTKDRTNVERIRLEAHRFEKKQATKQRLIDAATIELKTRITGDNRRIEAQVEAQRTREENVEAKKQANFKRQKAAIDLSRKQQLEVRSKERGIEEAEIAFIVAAWRRKSAEIDAEEASEEAKLKAKNNDIRDFLKIQIGERKMREKVEQTSKLDFDFATRKAVLDDDRRFHEVADAEIAKAKAKGLPTYMLLKARNVMDVTIQPSSGTRI